MKNSQFNRVSYIDSTKSIDEVSARNATLVLELGSSRFRMAVHINGHYVAFEDYSTEGFSSNENVLDQISQIFFNHPLLGLTEWKEIIVVTSSETFTNIPTELYRKEYAPQYLRFVKGKPVPSAEKLLTYTLPTNDYVTIFSMPLVWWEFLEEHFSLQNIQYLHSSDTLTKIDTESKYLIVLNFEDTRYTVRIHNGNQLILVNQFQYTSASEAVYFLLATLQQLNIDLEQSSCILLGEITPFSETYSELVTFLPHITFAKKPDAFTYIGAFEELPDHRYYSLLNACYVLS